MTALNPDELEAAAAGVAAAQAPPVLTLDPDRVWHRVECSNGHENFIADDPADGTAFECGACGGAKNVIPGPPAPEEEPAEEAGA